MPDAAQLSLFAEAVDLDELAIPQFVQAKLADLEASNAKLQSENLTLRLRLARRKSRVAFERRILVMLGLWLVLLAIILGWVCLTVIKG